MYYISCLCYNVSVRLSVRLSVTFVRCCHRVQWIPDTFACLDRWMSLPLTDNASPGSSDGMMPGFLVDYTQRHVTDSPQSAKMAGARYHTGRCGRCGRRVVYTDPGICRRRVSVRPSVCLSVSVCVSVTLRYCIKTAKRRITQITPHDSPVT